MKTSGSAAGMAQNRNGVQKLLAEVTMDYVGMVLGLEISRFVRAASRTRPRQVGLAASVARGLDRHAPPSGVRGCVCFWSQRAGSQTQHGTKQTNPSQPH